MKTKQFYFFIGRTTPPHFGHIHVLRETIELARASKTCALFLLGNGPGGVRTRENPVEHDTKSAFIAHKLKKLGYNEGSDFVIEMMRQPPNRQVEAFVRERIAGAGADAAPDHISIFQVAGGKDDDTTKHEFVRTSTCGNLQKEYNEKPEFYCGVITIDAVSGGVSESGVEISAMSATKVRNKAVDCYVRAKGDEDTAFADWVREFPFYDGDDKTRELSRDIFNQIIQYKDTEVKSKTQSATARVRASPYPTPTKSRTAKRDPSPRSKGHLGGRSRSHVRARSSHSSRVSRNKRTRRNNRK